MSLSSIELWQRISASELADATLCRAWAARAAKVLSASDATDGLKLLQLLVKLGYVTNYQAKCLAGQSDLPLKLGRWNVLRQLQGPIWSGWFEVRAISNARDAKPVLRWSKSLSRQDLTQLTDALPSLEFAQRQGSVSGRHLQSVDRPEIVDNQVQLQLEPVKGLPLAELYEAGVPDAQTTQTIVQQLCLGLLCMHKAQLAHGSIGPDRVFWDGQEVTLVRDPLCRFTTSLNGQACGTLGKHPRAVSSLHFLAPEFIAPGQLPTLTSDVFSVGCLWWWLLTGEPIARGTTPQQILAAHASKVPVLPVNVGLEKPMERVLRYALAKQPAHRFASATELCLAMNAAIELVRASKQLAGSTGSKSARISKSSTDPLQPAGNTDRTAENAKAQTLTDVADKPPAKKSRQRDARDKRESRTAASPSPPPKIGRRKNSSGKWMLPVMGGCGLLIVLLLALHFSGALSMGSASEAARKPPPYTPKAPRTEIAETDPLADLYVIVDSSEAALWAPPTAPIPLSLELLPPGGQLFLAIRPSSLVGSGSMARLRGAFGTALESALGELRARAGVGWEEMRQCTLAFYSAKLDGAMPQTAIRVELTQGVALANLLQVWGATDEGQTPGASLFVVDDAAYFVPVLEAGDDITKFAVGPVDLMREVAETQGLAGPLLSQVEKLRKASDSGADLTILASAPYLFTEGRGLLVSAPERLRSGLQDLIGNNTRAVLLQTRFAPKWYLEARVIGQSDQDAGRIAALFESKAKGLAAEVEAWLVEQTPHPYWRALALRYPQMLRALAAYSRFGVEDGVAIMNTYLPSEASENLLLASWLALQERAVISGDTAVSTVPDADEPLGIQAYLSRPIKVSFAQEPIESAWQLVGEEANDGLPSGRALRFELDGDAFQNAGITRNQQLRDFMLENKPVREALTEIARRGNPVTTVSDPREKDQQLVWVVNDDPLTPGSQRILLTTRTAANAAGIELPPEFTPGQ